MVLENEGDNTDTDDDDGTGSKTSQAQDSMEGSGGGDGGRRPTGRSRLHSTDDFSQDDDNSLESDLRRNSVHLTGFVQPNRRFSIDSSGSPTPVGSRANSISFDMSDGGELNTGTKIAAMLAARLEQPPNSQSSFRRSSFSRRPSEPSIPEGTTFGGKSGEGEEDELATTSKGEDGDISSIVVVRTEAAGAQQQHMQTPRTSTSGRVTFTMKRGDLDRDRDSVENKVEVEVEAAPSMEGSVAVVSEPEPAPVTATPVDASAGAIVNEDDVQAFTAVTLTDESIDPGPGADTATSGNDTDAADAAVAANADANANSEHLALKSVEDVTLPSEVQPFEEEVEGGGEGEGEGDAN